MNNFTDTQLKRAQAKMLPEKLIFYSQDNSLVWRNPRQRFKNKRVQDTELLQICWEIEKTLTQEQKEFYAEALNNAQKDQEHVESYFYTVFRLTHSNCQQRTEALAKVKGVEIV